MDYLSGSAGPSLRCHLGVSLALKGIFVFGELGLAFQMLFLLCLISGGFEPFTFAHVTSAHVSFGSGSSYRPALRLHKRRPNLWGNGAICGEFGGDKVERRKQSGGVCDKSTVGNQSVRRHTRSPFCLFGKF